MSKDFVEDPKYMKYFNNEISILKKLYHKNPEEYQQICKALFFAPYTIHLDTTIKQFNYPMSHPAFFCYTGEIVLFLENILKENYRLNCQIQSMPPVAIRQFEKQSLIDEIQYSNDIEGVRSTRREIKLALDSQETNDKSKRLYSVVNKYNKLLQGKEISFQTCEDIRYFYDDFVLKEVILENPKNAPDGQLFRKESVSVTKSSDREIHRGLYPENKIIETLTYALKILNNDQFPKLVSISIFHYLFGYIHPFYDGNGRISRFITSYYLSKELSPAVALKLSMMIKKNREEYYKLFDITNSYKNYGDLTPFITYFLHLIYNTVIDVRKTLNSTAQKLEKYQLILNKKLSDAGITDKLTKDIYFILLQAALFSIVGGATIEEICATVHKSRNTVDARIAKIDSRHIIKDTSAQQYRYRLNSLFLR